MDLTIIVNIILSILSFVLAAVSVITVILSLKQNKRILEANEMQLKEMRNEHQLSTQPIIALNNVHFLINRPRFYYTPPLDKYSFEATYSFEAIIRNVSIAAAICVDMTAELIVPTEDEEYVLHAVSSRYNILCQNNKPEKLNIRFAGDSSAKIIEAIRESNGKMLPQISIEALYQNTTGGFFKSKQKYILVPREEDADSIRNWHTRITSAPIEAKEVIDKLTQFKHHDEVWEEVFALTKNGFNLSLGMLEIDKIIIRCLELPNEYEYTILQKEEYNELMSSHGYGHYVQKNSDCAKRL